MLELRGITTFAQESNPGSRSCRYAWRTHSAIESTRVPLRKSGPVLCALVQRICAEKFLL